MKSLLRSFALIGLLAVVGCDANPDGPDVGDGKNTTGKDNTPVAGEKAAPISKKIGGTSAGASAPQVSKPD
jgi:hypothetical protein